MITLAQKPPSRGNIAALIVTYHPDSGFGNRLRRILGQVEAVVVVDNTPEPHREPSFPLLASEKVQLILNSSNEGLGYALNQGMKWAIDRNFAWVLTLDQDTVVDLDMVDRLCEIASIDHDLQSLALIASNARSFESGRLYLRNNGTGSLYREVKTPMTSGSLTSAAIFKKIGGFLAEFFIGSIDLEYCLRARSQGFRILCSERALMTHAAGATIERRFLGRTVLVGLQSLTRWYLDFRNLTRTIRWYFYREPSWTAATLWALFKRLILLITFETERLPKARAIFRGVRDGLSDSSEGNPVGYFAVNSDVPK